MQVKLSQYFLNWILLSFTDDSNADNERKVFRPDSPHELKSHAQQKIMNNRKSNQSPKRKSSRKFNLLL